MFFREEAYELKQRSLFANSKSSRHLILGLFAIFCLLAISACGGGSNTVHIYDNAGVLNVSQVQNSASNLSKDVDIYTVNNFHSTKAQFQQETRAKLGGDANRIVMAIDTTGRYLYIVRGSNVPLSSSDIGQTVNSFSANFNNGDYTNATVSALGTMNNSLQAKSNSGAGFPFALCLIPLVLLGALFFIFRARSRSMGRPGFFSGFGGGPRMDPPQQPGYPYNQGYNQGGYYGPGNQGGGMNPLVAGGLGAAAGGLLGYELGKEQGERQGDMGDQGDYDGGNFGNGGDLGGGGNFGGGDAGGGGNFGGGDAGGGNFGGGGDFGGGGGGDFGGGGGNF
jgi:hypothetical protein